MRQPLECGEAARSASLLTVRAPLAGYASVRACLRICGISQRAGHVNCEGPDFNLDSTRRFIEALQAAAVAPDAVAKRKKPAAAAVAAAAAAAPRQHRRTPRARRSANRRSCASASAAEQPAAGQAARRVQAAEPAQLHSLAVSLGTLEAGQRVFATQLAAMSEQQRESLAAIRELSGAVQTIMDPAPPEMPSAVLAKSSEEWAAAPRGGGLTIDTASTDVDAAAADPEPAMELGVLAEGFFDEADADHDGFVTKAEFVAHRRKQCGEPPSLEDWKLFYAADANGDGRISKREFDDFCAAQWGDTRARHDAGDGEPGPMTRAMAAVEAREEQAAEAAAAHAVDSLCVNLTKAEQDLKEIQYEEDESMVDLDDAELNSAALRIQATHRGKSGRRQYQERRDMNDAALRIQAAHRGKYGRREFQERQAAAHSAALTEQEQEQHEEEQQGLPVEGSVDAELDAAVRIQARHRGRQGREAASHRRTERRREDSAATRVQALQRGKMARQQAAAEQTAATRVQALQRGKMARQQAAAEQAAATRVQAQQRGRMARRLAAEDSGRDSSELEKLVTPFT